MRITFATFTLILALCAPSFSAEKKTLAVMDFIARDVPKEEAAKISMLVRNEMSNLQQFNMLDRGQIVKALGADIECDDVSCAVAAGKKLGARSVIVGTILKFGENLTVTGRVIDVESGSILLAEKERAVFQADELYMIERFCDKIARRMTGKNLYDDERAGGAGSGASAITYSASEYRPAADPTAWLMLGAGIASGIGFLEAAASFNRKKNSYYFNKMMLMSLWQIGADPVFPDPQLQLVSLLGYINEKNNIAHARRIRTAEYYIATGIGGFAGLMFVTFIGRNIAHAVKEGREAKKGSIKLEISSRFADKVPEDVRTPFGFGIGLAMRF